MSGEVETSDLKPCLGVSGPLLVPSLMSPLVRRDQRSFHRMSTDGEEGQETSQV